MEDRKRIGARLVLGLILITLGALYLLENMGWINAAISDIIVSWPMLLILIGIVSMINSQQKTFGILVFIAGCLFMIPEVIPSITIDHDLILPIIIILLGILLIFRSKSPLVRRNSFFNQSSIPSQDRMEVVSIFGGGERIFSSQNFQGGNITSIFGGGEVDLTQCRLAPGDQVIDVIAIFGGFELKVPSTWKVKVDVLPIFGGISDKFRRDPSQFHDSAGTLYIKGFVLFGGGEIKMF